MSVKWDPSEHRFGRKFDHGLVSVIWHWRTKKTAKFEPPNFKAMNNQSWKRFDKDLQIRIKNRQETRAKLAVTSATAATATKCVGNKGSSSKDGEEYSELTEDIRKAIEETVPKKKNLFKNGRAVSEETKELYKQRRKEFSKPGKLDAQSRKKWNKKIKNACRNDYRGWVSRWTEHIERADAKGDLKAVHRGVRALSGAKNRFSHTQPTTDEKGQRLKNPVELANVWSQFLGRKFAATDLECMRAEYEALPARKDGEGDLTRAEFDSAVKKMKAQKATGIDGVPAEVWQHSTLANEMLFKFLKKIWAKETVPAELAVGVFVMLHKKGSPEACANYRCIGLLNHGYKIMTVILLQRLIEECASFFSD